MAKWKRCGLQNRHARVRFPPGSQEMTNKKILALALIIMGLSSILYSGLEFYRNSQAKAGLKVYSTPISTVFLNGTEIGLTPQDLLTTPGEATIKLVPKGQAPYETKVRLTPKVYTVLKRTFSKDPNQESGELITLEPDPEGNTTVVIITTSPDSANVFLNSEPLGITPLMPTQISPKAHTFTLSANNFLSKDIPATIEPGFRLFITAKLAGSTPVLPLPPVASPSSEPSTTPQAQ